MPIMRSYMCEDCGNFIEVMLTMAQADEPPPACERCLASMRQEFKPVAIGGSNRSKAEKITEDILRNDYHVADMQPEHRPEGTPTARYQAPAVNKGTWGIAQEALLGAIQTGRQSRLKYGSGLDVLQQNLKSGVEPDLLAISKRRAYRVY